MVIFRENTEDVYADKELQAGTPKPLNCGNSCMIGLTGISGRIPAWG